MALTTVKSDQIQTSVALAGSPTTTTQSASDNSTKVATTAYVETAVANLVASAPTALNTLDELAAALNDDASFSTTVTNSIATKLPLTGGTLTGDLDIKGGATPLGVYRTLAIAADTQSEIVLGSQDLSNNYVDAVKIRGLLKANKTDGELVFYTRNSGTLTTALTLNSSQNATFAGNLTVNANTNITGNLTVDTNSFYVDAGNNRVGIGTSSPDVPLDVEGAIQASESGGDFIRMQTDGTNNIFDINSGDYVFRTAGFAQRLRITSSGNVGMGELSPDGKLHVRGGSSAGGQVWIQTDGTFAGTDEAQLNFRHYDDTGAAGAQIKLIGTTNYAGDMVFSVRGGGTSGAGGATLIERMRIDSSGNISIGGSTAANRTLSMKGASNNDGFFSTFGTGFSMQVARHPLTGTFTNTSTAAAAINLNTANADSSISFWTTTTNNVVPTQRMSIDSSGIIRIGPDLQDIQIYPASVSGSNNLIYMRGNASGDKSEIQMNHYGFADFHIGVGHVANGVLNIANSKTGSDFVINGSGNVGIAISSPTQAKLVARTASGMSIAAVKDNTGASMSFGGVTQPRVLLEAGPSTSQLKMYTAAGSSYGSATWQENLRIDNSAGSGHMQMGAFGVTGLNTVAAIHGVGNDATLVLSNGNLANSNSSYGWQGRGGRMLASNGTGWQSADGSDPALVIGSDNDATLRNHIGIALHNEDQSDDRWSPMIGFSNRSNSGSYNTMYGYIMGRKVGQGVDANWSTGEIHMDTGGTRIGTTTHDAYMAQYPAFMLDQHGDINMPFKAFAYGNVSGGTYTPPANGTGFALNVQRYQNCTPQTTGYGPGITITKAGFYVMYASILYDPAGTYVYIGWCVNGTMIHHWHSNHTIASNHDAVTSIGRYLSVGDHITVENFSQTITTLYGNAHSTWYMYKVG